jgi:hypothetical protein
MPGLFAYAGSVLDPSPVIIQAPCQLADRDKALIFQHVTTGFKESFELRMARRGSLRTSISQR